MIKDTVLAVEIKRKIMQGRVLRTTVITVITIKRCQAGRKEERRMIMVMALSRKFGPRRDLDL